MTGKDSPNDGRPVSLPPKVNYLQGSFSFNTVVVPGNHDIDFELTQPKHRQPELPPLSEKQAGMAVLALFAAFVVSQQKSGERMPGKISSDTPRIGELAMWFICLNKDAREALLGEMSEGFATLVSKRGRKTAVTWYWWMVIRSAGPLLWAALVRVVALRALVKKLGL